MSSHTPLKSYKIIEVVLYAFIILFMASVLWKAYHYPYIHANFSSDNAPSLSIPNHPEESNLIIKPTTCITEPNSLIEKNNISKKTIKTTCLEKKESFKKNHKTKVLNDPSIKKKIQRLYSKPLIDFNNINCKYKGKFNEHQQDIINRSYLYGSQYNLGLTLASIAIKESSAGEFLINPDWPYVYGVFHIQGKTAFKRLGITNRYQKTKLIQALMTDFETGAALATAELLYWKKIHKNNLIKVWGSYYAGWNGNRTSGKKYANEIGHIISNLLTCKIR